ncbi:hypothetical protein CL622_03810 [archaeon]|nr:hypothetical protein [archaeon]|tara:strand:+ start:957 stop:1154 length:198 start_codon:yes stop_codon:yes gene_type:complete
MAKNHIFKFRLTKRQLEYIRQESKIEGYISVAAYVRDRLLSQDKFIASKIIETHQNVKELLAFIK